MIEHFIEIVVLLTLQTFLNVVFIVGGIELLYEKIEKEKKK